MVRLVGVVAFVCAAGCGRLSFKTPGDGDVDAQADAALPWNGAAYATGGATFQASATTLSLPVAVRSTDYVVVAVGWNDPTSLVTAVADSAGSQFMQLTPHQRGGGVTQVLFVAATPLASATDNVTVVFNSTVTSASLIVTVFENARQEFAVPLSSAGGTGQTASVAITTDVPDSLVVAAVTGTFDALEGAGYTPVAATSGVRHLVEIKEMPVSSSYIAGATFLNSSDWVIQTFALRPQ